MVAAGECSAQWSLRKQWTAVSDHTIVYARRSPISEAPKHIACTPARFWSLPQEARAELREDFEHIAISLQVPRAQGDYPSPKADLVPRRDNLDPQDPLVELSQKEDTPTQPDLETLPPAELRKQYGNHFLQTMDMPLSIVPLEPGGKDGDAELSRKIHVSLNCERWHHGTVNREE